MVIFFCFAKGHTRHGNSDSTKSMHESLLCSNCILEIEGWPDLWCQTSNKAIFDDLEQLRDRLAKGKEGKDLEFIEELPDSCKK